MNKLLASRVIWLSSIIVCTMSIQASGATITNGGFETGLVGWTSANQVGSEGDFFSQTGVLSPVNSFAVPAPPGGIRAAMTDAAGPGSHVLYQDFVVPSVVPGALIGFSLFINNSNGAPDFFSPALLDFATPTLNQQARVDIIKTSANPFSVASSDVLQNLYQTKPGDPLRSGYSSFNVDITALLQSQLGQTLRLRFAEVDNVAAFNLGVDNVEIAIGANAIPEPSTWLLSCAALLSLGIIRRRT
jgi:hypothetical protein